MPRLPQEALNRQRHGHPRPPGPQGIRHQVQPCFPLFFFFVPCLGFCFPFCIFCYNWVNHI